MFFDRLAKGSNEKDRNKELNTTGKDNGSDKNSNVIINGKQMPHTDTKDVIISDSAPIRVNVNLKMGIQPIKTPGEIKWMLHDEYDLSDIPEPWYRIASYMQQFCSFYRSKNKKDLLQIQPACDLFYILNTEADDTELIDEDHDGVTIKGWYAPDMDMNVASCVAGSIEKRNQECYLKNRRFKAANRKKDGFVHEFVTLRSCSKETEPRCYLARTCKFCLANIASYIHYLRQTDPEEEKRQRMKYAAKAAKTYQDMEALPFHFSDDILEKLTVSSASLRFAKRMIDMGAVLPHATLNVTEGTYRLVLAYPPCLEELFSKDYKGEFSEVHLLKICEGKPLIPYDFWRTITIPGTGIKQEKYFLKVFNGRIIDNVAMLFCLVALVYDLLQQGKYVSYMTRCLQEEEESVKEIENEFLLGKNLKGFYGSIIGSDKKSVTEKAAMLSTVLQAKCPYLSPACAFISLTDFMESLMTGGGDGSSDSFHVDFLEPKRNMIYILDGISFWMQYSLKFANPDYTNNRSRMLKHCLQILREYRPNFYIILTGNQKEMDSFMRLDSSFKTLFGEHRIVIADKAPEELYRQFTLMLEDTNTKITVDKNEFISYVVRNLDYFPFDNDSLVCYLSDYVKTAGRLPADFNTRNEQTFEEALHEMVGLENVKEQMIRFSHYVRFVQQAKESRMDIPASNFHMLFTGNPGTGKTTVARIVARMLYDCGICRKDKFTEIQSTDMVGQYLGQTGPKTKELIENAMDGVLFIDEAYAITDGDGPGTNDYGKEALAVLIKMMEDYKDRIVVIFAGYKDKMDTFVDTNPGMKSRIGYTFEFHDYSEAELVEIFCRKAKKAGFVLEKGVKEKVGECVKGVSSQKDFGNGRYIDKLFQEVMVEHAMNLNGNQNLKILSVNDIPSRGMLEKMS